MNSTPGKSPRSPESYFLEALGEGRLEVQECRQCGRSFFFPRVHCTLCGSMAYRWRPMQRGATIYSFTEIPPSGPSPKRNVILAEMDEGFRMMSTVVTDDELHIGMRVSAAADSENARVIFKLEE